ncbi:PSME3-interacting protein [Lucilia cuprina]|uniref:PSME3-interacting protein n=1 Tax=Lucilia cuprina TaxID=7375 RepID=UPI001F06F537|nr:PSME3-interacting protein [Lucilia cuprina]
MSSGFVTETEINEARQRRQEEWEKVRQPDEPLERPEEPYDGRSLFERLKEQKMKKDMEYEEAHKLKNLIRGLDDDEVQFLELVDKNKMDMEKKQMLEEEQELKDFRSRVATLQEESVDKKIQNDLKTKIKPQTSTTTTARLSQKSLLGIGIKRKNGEVKSPVGDSSKQVKLDNKEEKPAVTQVKDIKDLPCIQTDKLDKGQLKCVAILPGLGPYNESSDSEISSGSDDEPQGCEDNGKYDLVGRKHPKKKHDHQD